MKKRAIFLMMLVVLFSLFTTSLSRVSAAESEPAITTTTGSTVIHTADGGVAYAKNLKHADEIDIKYSTGVETTADTVIHIKGHVKEIYRSRLVVYSGDTVLYDDGGYFFAEDKAEDSVKLRLTEDNYFVYHGNLGLDLAGKTITRIKFQIYTTNKTEDRIGEFQLLGIHFDTNATYDGFADLYKEEKIEVTLPTEFEWKSASSDVVLENNVATINTTNLQYGVIYTEFEPITNLDKITLYYSIKYKATGITNFETVAYDNAGTYAYCGRIIPASSSSSVVIDHYENYSVATISLTGNLGKLVNLSKITYNVQAEAVGSTLEILDFVITEDGKHGFELPMIMGDVTSDDKYEVSQSEAGLVVSYGVNAPSSWGVVKFEVKNYDKNKSALEFVFTPEKETVICFSVDGNKYKEHDTYLAGEKATYTMNLNEAPYLATDNFTIQIFFDANFGNDEAKSVTFHSIRFYNPNLTELEYSVSDLTVDYTGSPVELEVECAEDVEFKYEYAVAGTTDWVAGTPTNAGSYVVKVSYVGDAFLENSKEVNVVINKVKAEAPALEDVTVDPNTRIVTIHKAGIEVYLESADGVEVYDGDEISYGETLFYRYAGDENHEPSDFVEFTFVKPHVHTFEEGWTHDETHHWHAASCAHTEEVDGKAEHEYNVPGHGNGYTWMECLCGRVDETTKEAHATYLHTYNPGDGTRTDNLKATLNEDGTYSFEMTTPKWGRFVLYYNGVAIASDQVTMLTGTAWVDGTYTGGYPFYNDADSGDKTTFISAIGGDYTVKYNPTENTLLLGEYVEPLPEGAHKVAVNNADAGGNQIAVFVTAGDVIRNNSGAYPHHPGQWDPYRLFIVIDSNGRVAYMCLMPIKGYGNPYEGSYARHSVYANYRENPAFGNLSDEYAGQWGTTVDWSLIVPEGGYVISAHGDAATAIGKEILNNPDFVGTDNYENMVNSKTINVDSITVTYNAEKNYLLVESHEHVASTEWEKDGSNHWHTCTVCEGLLDKASHTAAVEWNKDETNHWHLCSECGVEMDKAEHSWGDGEVTEAPSHTEAGVRTFTCSCGQTKTAEEPAVGHSHSTEWSKDATHHWHECSCGDKADKAEHTYGEGVVTKEPTTEAKGEKTFTCSCGHSYTEEIAKLEPAPQPEPEQKGCGGSVIASIFGVLALAGSVVVLRKKREE